MFLKIMHGATASDNGFVPNFAPLKEQVIPNHTFKLLFLWLL